MPLLGHSRKPTAVAAASSNVKSGDVSKTAMGFSFVTDADDLEAKQTLAKLMDRQSAIEFLEHGPSLCDGIPLRFILTMIFLIVFTTILFLSARRKSEQCKELLDRQGQAEGCVVW